MDPADIRIDPGPAQRPNEMDLSFCRSQFYLHVW